MSNNKTLSFGKIIYLDEQAVLDFLQLSNDGELSTIVRKMSESIAGLSAEASVGKSLFNLAKLKLSGNASHMKNNIVETQVSNTLISSFKKVIDDNDPFIVSLSDVKIFIAKDSPAYYRSLVPVFNMIEDINKVQSISPADRNNFSGFNLQGIEKTLDMLSGYYEFICIDKENKKMIVRFNISGLRNNYTLNDLTKMDLKLYGIKVSESHDSNLEFNHQMKNMLQEEDTPSIGVDFDDEASNEKLKAEIPIIDILMAGV